MGVSVRRKEQKMKKLGFGLMRLPQTDPEDWSSVGMDKTKAMMDRDMAGW